MEMHDRAKVALEFLKHYEEQGGMVNPDTHAKILDRIFRDLNIGTTDKNIDITTYNHMNGSVRLMNIKEFLTQYSLSDLDNARRNCEHDIRELERALEGKRKHLERYNDLAAEAEEMFGLVDHVKENYQDAVFDYEIRKGT